MSDTNRMDLPPPGSSNFTQRVRETLQTYLGKQGNILDRGLTLRDLIENGFASLPSGWGGNGSGTIPLNPGKTITSSYTTDLTPPPEPTGFKLDAAISHVFIQHDSPGYSVGHGHLRTRVYGVKYKAGDPLPTFANAVDLGQFSGTIWGMTSDPATTWRLWIKWETVDGVLSNTPAGGTNGLEATTGQDVALLLTALTGKLKQEQLYSTLSSRINLIDGPDSLAGSVAARIKTESQERTTADSAISQSVTTLQASVNGNTSAIQAEATTRANADNSLFAQYTVKIDQNGYVSGYGLASTAKDATPTSTFAVRADSFYIASPSGPGIAPTMPFIVRTTPVTINGVEVPAGVYITDGFIQNGTITNAKIANAAIDDAKIANLSAGKINTGYLSADRIQSGSLDAKIANLDAAVINSGIIGAARIGDASIETLKLAGNTVIVPASLQKIGQISGYFKDDIGYYKVDQLSVDFGNNVISSSAAIVIFSLRVTWFGSNGIWFAGAGIRNESISMATYGNAFSSKINASVSNQSETIVGTAVLPIQSGINVFSIVASIVSTNSLLISESAFAHDVVISVFGGKR